VTRGTSAMGIYLLGIGLTVIGTSIFNVLPLVTAAAADNLGFTDGQVGVLSHAITAGARLSAFLVTPGNYRPVMWLVVVATSVSVVLFIVSSVSDDSRIPSRARHLCFEVIG
jgi:hypothetical protein